MKNKLKRINANIVVNTSDNGYKINKMSNWLPVRIISDFQGIIFSLTILELENNDIVGRWNSIKIGRRTKIK